MKFTIRDLLLVTVIVAILGAWWVDRSALKARVEKLEQPTPQEFIGALRERGKNVDSIDPPLVQHIEELPILDHFGSPPRSSALAPNQPKP